MIPLNVQMNKHDVEDDDDEADLESVNEQPNMQGLA